MSRRSPGKTAVVSRAALALAVAVPVLLTGAVPALAQSTADIQWAQTILKDKGFDIGGRANGQMTPQTRSALSAYQKSVGLPATGQLDQATVSRMMGDREKKAAPTMGSLSKSQIGQSVKEKEVAPRAAPTQRIDSGNETVGGMAQFGSGPPPVSSHSTAAPAAPAATSRAASPQTPVSVGPASAQTTTAANLADDPSPQAAPRGAVSATDASGKPVPVVQKGEESSGLPGWFANLMRYGLMGLLAVLAGGIGFAWWRSGRTGSATRPDIDPEAPSQDNRREPSFGTGRREELTVPPGFGEMRARR